jgi:cytochrome c biogenesis protein CcdA
MKNKAEKITANESSWQQKHQRNTTTLGLWTAAWVITMALTNFGPRFIWDFNSTFTILAIVVNLAFGLKMIVANVKHLKGLDEMQQKIQLNAMGITLGIGLVVGLAYSNLDVVNIITFDAEISHLVIFMGLTYLTATFIANKNYQ